MSTQCWSFGPDMRRCDLDGGHTGNHQVNTTWADEESLTFEGLSAVVEPPTLPIHDSVLVDAAFSPPSDKCFSCGCTKAAHEVVGGDDQTMCEKHQCRQWLA